MAEKKPAPPAAPPAAPLGGDLSSLLSDDDRALLAASSGDDEDMMKVFVKHNPGKQVMADALDKDGKMIEVPAGPIRFEGEGDETKTVGEYKKDYYRKHPGDLNELKNRLFLGGFYDASIEAGDLRGQDYDDETNKAWKRAVARAAAFYDAGEKKTLDEVIDIAIQNRSQNEKDGKTGKRAPLSVELTHPDDIRTAAMKVSTNILGRGWGEDQLNRFVSAYQSMENSAQRAAYGAGEAGGTSTAAPSMAAAAERAARESNPVAAGATDMVNAYNLVMEAISSLGAK